MSSVVIEVEYMHENSCIKTVVQVVQVAQKNKSYPRNK